MSKINRSRQSYATSAWCIGVIPDIQPVGEWHNGARSASDGPYVICRFLCGNSAYCIYQGWIAYMACRLNPVHHTSAQQSTGYRHWISANPSARSILRAGSSLILLPDQTTADRDEYLSALPPLSAVFQPGQFAPLNLNSTPATDQSTDTSMQTTQRGNP